MLKKKEVKTVKQVKPFDFQNADRRRDVDNRCLVLKFGTWRGNYNEMDIYKATLRNLLVYEGEVIAIIQLEDGTLSKVNHNCVKMMDESLI